MPPCVLTIAPPFLPLTTVRCGLSVVIGILFNLLGLHSTFSVKLTTCTLQGSRKCRPDTINAVCTVGSFLSSHLHDFWIATSKVLANSSLLALGQLVLLVPWSQVCTHRILRKDFNFSDVHSSRAPFLLGSLHFDFCFLECFCSPVARAGGAGSLCNEIKSRESWGNEGD